MSKGIIFRNHANEKIYPCPYFPIGSIYMSLSNTNPSTYFGGTWVQIKDRFLLGAGNTYVAGNTGGEASHTLTTNEIPNHRHDNIYGDNGARRGAGWGTGTTHTGTLNEMTNNDWESLHTGYTGGGKAHNNMPPYYVVYIWRRTA